MKPDDMEKRHNLNTPLFQLLFTLLLVGESPRTPVDVHMNLHGSLRSHTHMLTVQQMDLTVVQY